MGGQAGLRGLAWWGKGAKRVVGTKLWRTLEAKPETLRIEAQESLAPIDSGYLTRNSLSIFLSLGSRSGQQAVLAGSTSFLLSPPQPCSSTQTSASDLGPCLLAISVPNRGWQGRGGRSAGVGHGRRQESSGESCWKVLLQVPQKSLSFLFLMCLCITKI